jgi:hypothetical protein
LNDAGIKGADVVEVKPAVKGSFQVIVAGKSVCAYIGMARPFTKLKTADMDEMCESVVKAALAAQKS